ncbi:MAG: hypothetical protein AAGL66_11400 [Pseudomonadota bacterium]
MSLEPVETPALCESAAVLIGRAEAEVARLAELLEAVEGALSSALEIGGAEAIEREALQNFDMLTQSIAALSSFLKGLSATLPEASQVEVFPLLKEVELEAMRLRLSGHEVDVLAARQKVSLF